jgi:hypothetical protein
MFRRDMAARGIPWIPEFRIAIIFIVCQRILFRIKLSEVCGRLGIRCDWFMGEFSWLLSVRWRIGTGCAGKNSWYAGCAAN